MRALGLLVGCVALVTGCSSGSDRPSRDAVVTSFKSGKAGEAFKIPPGLLTDAQYRCIGAAIVDSELSDEAVAAIEDADTSYAFDDGETRELRNVGTAIQACKDS